MPKITYPRSSPYHSTKQTSWAIGRYEHRRIAPHPEDKPFVLEARHENRPDLLSQELYGTPVYYWVFMARNLKVIRHPIWDMRTGTRIFVPSRNYVNTIVG